MKTSKKAAKAKKVAAAQFVGMTVNVGVDADLVAAYDAAHKAVEVQAAEMQVVTVDQSQFNRAGFDSLMLANVGGAAAITQVVEEKKTVRQRVNDGFLGLTRRMYRRGCNGQEILEANRDARLAAGYEAKQAMIRAKKDYGYVVREAKAEKKAEVQAAEVTKEAVAV